MTEQKIKNRMKAPKDQQQQQQKQSTAPSTDNEVPTKFETQVAKFLRFNLPDKMAMFAGIDRVNYFIGSKAVDLLLESKFEFKTRAEVVTFMNNLLIKKFFHRAKKIVKIDGTKKKFKLDMHNYQVFEDSKEPYVWLYEPTSLKAWFLSFGVIILVVAICLFPLWPDFLRTGVYYLCIGSLILLVTFLALSLSRYVIYFIIYALSLGKVHFWLLPNLTEDVGFFESFVPAYTLDIGDQIQSPEAMPVDST